MLLLGLSKHATASLKLHLVQGQARTGNCRLPKPTVRKFLELNGWSANELVKFRGLARTRLRLSRFLNAESSLRKTYADSERATAALSFQQRAFLAQAPTRSVVQQTRRSFLYQAAEAPFFAKLPPDPLLTSPPTIFTVRLHLPWVPRNELT